MLVVTPTTELAEVAETLRQARERRDALILQMRAEGASLRAIAAQAGLDHTGVMHILRKKSGE